VIVVGGMACALLIHFPLEAIRHLPAVLRKCFFVRPPESETLQRQIAECATLIRRDGLLVLENRLPQIVDPLLARGLELVIAGVPREVLRETLAQELARAQEREAVGKQMLDQLGAMGPAFGLIGTLVGLVQMVRNLDDVSKIAAAMSSALLT